LTRRQAFFKFPKRWENSHKNGKILIKMGKFPFIAEHVAFEKRASFLQISVKMGNFP